MVFSDFATKVVYTFIIIPVCFIRPARLIVINFIT